MYQNFIGMTSRLRDKGVQDQDPNFKEVFTGGFEVLVLLLNLLDRPERLFPFGALMVYLVNGLQAKKDLHIGSMIHEIRGISTTSVSDKLQCGHTVCIFRINMYVEIWNCINDYYVILPNGQGRI